MALAEARLQREASEALSSVALLMAEQIGPLLNSWVTDAKLGTLATKAVVSPMKKI